MTEIVYLAHPVSAEDKAKYKAEGKRIVDAVYAPDGELPEVKEVKPARTRKVKDAEADEE